MRVLAISDVEDERLYERLPERACEFDVVVSCGDLHRSYLDYIATFASVPLLYVPGNHDTSFAQAPVAGWTPLDRRVVAIDGVRFAGLGGSLLYRENVVGYTESQMRRRCARLEARARLAGGIDVFVAHAPARGYGDLDDAPHRGFEAFNGLLRRLRPELMLYGHVHLDYGRIPSEQVHPSGTRLVNAYRSKIVTVKEPEGAALRSLGKRDAREVR